MDGWTSVLIRTERGRLAFQAARSKLDVRGLDDPAALLRLDALDKKIANRTLQRKLDPDAPLSSTSKSTCARTRDPTVNPCSSAITVTSVPSLHVPDEPTARAAAWLACRARRRRPDRRAARGRGVGGVVVVPLETLSKVGLTPPNSRMSSSVTAARSGSGWPVSGSGPNAARASSAG